MEEKKKKQIDRRKKFLMRSSIMENFEDEHDNKQKEIAMKDIYSQVNIF